MSFNVCSNMSEEEVLEKFNIEKINWYKIANKDVSRINL